MEKLIKKILFISFLFFIVPFVQGQTFDVSIEDPVVETYSGVHLNYKIDITNHMNILDEFTLLVKGDKIWWRDQNYLLVPIPSNSTETINQGFYPVGAEPGDYPFEMSVVSQTTKQEIKHTVVIKVKPDIALIDLKSVKEGENVKVTLTMDSKEKRSVELSYDFLDFSGEVIGTNTFTAALEEGETIVTEDIRFPLSPPGEYGLKVRMDDESKSSTFMMEEVRKLEKSVETIETILYDQTIILVKNLGNVEDSVEVSKAYASSDYVTGDVLTAGMFENAGERIFKRQVVVAAGDEEKIVYERQKWPFYIYVLVGIIIVVIFGVFTLNNYTNPKISKVYRKRGKNTSIMIGVKNTFSHTKNVIVRDWVSPLASVVMEEFESVRPIVRRSDAGTELIWSLGDMRPREERLISYKIKPVVRGHLKMSRASLRYRSKKGERKRIFSKSIFVK